MGGLYLANVTLHVFAALLWLGGMFFFALVGAPVLRSLEPPALRADLFRQLGERFRGIAWISIGVLVVTGTLNLYFRGLLHWEILGSGTFWSTRYGRALAWKLGGVTVMLVVSALHDFVLGPAASRMEPGSATAAAARRRAAWLARLNALAGIVVVLAAVRLARGG